MLRVSGAKTDFTLDVWEVVIDEGIKNWTESYGKPEIKNEFYYLFR